MAVHTGYINVYRSGFFHRVGKPTAFDRHGGDIYPDLTTALQNVEPYTHYIDTVPVQWNDQEECRPNMPDSIPVPLRETRGRS